MKFSRNSVELFCLTFHHIICAFVIVSDNISFMRSILMNRRSSQVKQTCRRRVIPALMLCRYIVDLLYLGALPLSFLLVSA